MNISIWIGIGIIIIYILTNLLIRDSEKKKKVFLLISFVFIFIILDIRKPISDLKYFLMVFKNMGGKLSNLSASRYAFLYRLLCVFIGSIWLNDRFFIFIVDLITIIGPYYIIKKYSKNYFLSTLLFVALGTYYMQFFIIRQSLAISFLLISIKYLDENKPIKFFSLVAIAGLFHTSAFLFAITYLLKFLKVSRKNLIFWIIIFAIIFVFRRNIVLILASTTEYYSGYIGSQFDVINDGQWKLIMYILLFIFCLLFKKIYDKNESSQLLLSIMLLVIYFQLIATSSTSFVRVANYFCFPVYLIPINVIENMKDKKTRMIIKLLVIIMYFIFVFFRNPINGYEIFF